MHVLRRLEEALTGLRSLTSLRAWSIDGDIWKEKELAFTHRTAREVCFWLTACCRSGGTAADVYGCGVSLLSCR